MTRSSRGRVLVRSVLLVVAVVAPVLGFAVGVKDGAPIVTIGNAPSSFAECDGPPPKPDWDACGNPPTPTPTATPTPGD